jgi:hypothetical protein
MSDNNRNEVPSSTPNASLLQKVGSWLKKEGYPLEFRATNVLRKHGFHTRQGVYVQADEDGPKREVDILAEMNMRAPAGLLRISNVIECKWSVDKPWVIFTSPTTRLAPAACVSQSISSVLGESIMWAIAGMDDLHSLQLFSTPSEGGFGGRQAFSKGNDYFYSAVQTAVGNCSAYVESYDKWRVAGVVPDIGVVGFPIVLVEGEIMRAYYDADVDDLKLELVPHVRCHWKGSTSFPFIATVDVVSMSQFDSFARKRAQDIEGLLNKMLPTYYEIRKFSTSGSPDDVNVSSGPRGTVGPPKLLREIRDNHLRSKHSDSDAKTPKDDATD